MSSSQWISATVRETPRSSSCSIDTGRGAAWAGAGCRVLSFSVSCARADGRFLSFSVTAASSMPPSLPGLARLYHARQMDISAKGLRVLVTAGAAGIGRAIASTFLEHGARVLVCDVDEKALASVPKDIFRIKADV